MTTLPPPSIKLFGSETLEKKAYNLANSFSNYLLQPNDRNRLGYNLFKHLSGDGETPEVIVNTGKYHFTGIDKEGFVQLLKQELSKLKV